MNISGNHFSLVISPKTTAQALSKCPFPYYESISSTLIQQLLYSRHCVRRRRQQVVRSQRQLASHTSKWEKTWSGLIEFYCHNKIIRHGIKALIEFP